MGKRSHNRKKQAKPSGSELNRQNTLPKFFTDHERVLNKHPTLVLNAAHKPISYNIVNSTFTWQEAIKSILAGTHEVIEYYDDIVVRTSGRSSVNTEKEYMLPSVIREKSYFPKKNDSVLCTRLNVYLRDGYVCGYCDKKFSTKDLTWDHLKPQSKGGKDTWENLVTCCMPCNTKKGDKTVKGAGMTLLHPPFVPSYDFIVQQGIKFTPKGFIHKSWAEYLYWNVVLGEY